jgi:leucyl/phenylalanyl-tRNA--protein transferase
VVPLLLPPGAPLGFPDARLAGPDGLVAIGGDLSPERLHLAYREGVFPWFSEGQPPLWWSPDPRAVLRPERLHVPRSVARRMRRGGFELRWDADFDAVIRACGERRQDGTWILPSMIRAYTALHRAGNAHCLAVWIDGELAGGIYGVRVGALFAAESMFHRVSDMSKVALVTLVRELAARGCELIEVQFLTPHLERFGAEEISRDDYLAELLRLRDRRLRPSPRRNGREVAGPGPSVPLRR